MTALNWSMQKNYIAQQLVLEELDDPAEVIPTRQMLAEAVGMAFNTGHLHEDRLRIMVASFSEEGDQLSQWRGYAGNSTGVSLGLDLRGIRSRFGPHGVLTFAPCVYIPERQRALLKATFVHFRNAVQGAIAEIARNREPNRSIDGPQLLQQIFSESSQERAEAVGRCYSELFLDLLRIAPLLKNESFAEEKEWRLVLPWEYIVFPSQHQFEFRSTRETLVPYIPFPLNMPNQEGPIFCKEVILGPGSHPAAASAVGLFLQRQQIPIWPKPSKIPFRPS